jgi:hypothetical protein
VFAIGCFDMKGEKFDLVFRQHCMTEKESLPDQTETKLTFSKSTSRSTARVRVSL